MEGGTCEDEKGDNTCLPPGEIFEEPYELSCVPPCLPGMDCLLKSLPEFKIYTVCTYEQLYNLITKISAGKKTLKRFSKKSSSFRSQADTVQQLSLTGDDIPQEPPRITLSSHKEEPIYILFTSTISKAGQMWDSMCERAEYLLDRFTDTLDVTRNIHFIKVRLQKHQVKFGSQFERDPIIRLWAIPMMMRWGGPQRVNPLEFYNVEVLKLFFEEDRVNTPSPVPSPTCVAPPPEQEIVHIVDRKSVV